MESALPYRIPGPAGGVCTQPASQTANAPEKPLPNLFRTAPWREMLAHLNRKIPSSIALLRRNALSNDFAKLATLPVLIDSLVYVGKDASVVLRDPTGHIRGTIHADVFVERKGVLDRGVVLLLNGVSALAYLEESRGFRGGEDFVHLSVQACHVSEVFKGGNALPSAPPSRSFLDDYEPQARSPKPVVKPPVVRPPLRERNYQRPVSRGFQPTSRDGGRGGRGQSPYHHQQSRPNSSHRMNQRYSKHPYQQYQRQNNPNHPPYNQSASDQRPAAGSHQHKRPFRPPSMRSSATERAMPPPQKRPNVLQYRQPNPPPRQQSAVAGAITDDQLESLLGDLDVDAIIAAHGKSNSVPPDTNPKAQTGPQPVQKGNESESSVRTKRDQERSKVSSPTQQTAITNVSDSDRRQPGATIENEQVVTRRDRSSVPQLPPITRIRSPTLRREEVIDLTANGAQPDAPNQTDQLTISNVDQDMVNDLFEGVDASDFM